MGKGMGKGIGHGKWTGTGDMGKGLGQPVRLECIFWKYAISCCETLKSGSST